MADGTTLMTRSRALHTVLDQREPLHRSPGRLPWALRLHRLTVAVACRRPRRAHQLAAGMLGGALFGLSVLVISGGQPRPSQWTGLFAGLTVALAATVGWALVDAARCAADRTSRGTWLADQAWRHLAAIRAADAGPVVDRASRTVLVEVERAAAMLTARGRRGRALRTESVRWVTVTGAEPRDVLQSLLINDVALLAAVAEHVSTCTTLHHQPGADPRIPDQAWDILVRTT